MKPRELMWMFLVVVLSLMLIYSTYLRSQCAVERQEIADMYGELTNKYMERSAQWMECWSKDIVCRR
jgi:hypothetical protein